MPLLSSPRFILDRSDSPMIEARTVAFIEVQRSTRRGGAAVFPSAPPHLSPEVRRPMGGLPAHQTKRNHFGSW